MANITVNKYGRVVWVQYMVFGHVTAAPTLAISSTESRRINIRRRFDVDVGCLDADSHVLSGFGSESGWADAKK